MIELMEELHQQALKQYLIHNEVVYDGAYKLGEFNDGELTIFYSQDDVYQMEAAMNLRELARSKGILHVESNKQTLRKSLEKMARSNDHNIMDKANNLLQVLAFED